MDITLETIQALAPDQASLNAAKKLLKPAKWPVLGQFAASNVIWGQCQGSGANPYYTVADPVEHGYKCTCPSRKFPCKHVLALLWQFADDKTSFNDSPPPEWVNDWLGRKRKGQPKADNADNADNADKNQSTAKKNIHATTEETNKTLSPEEQTKRDAARLKRQQKIKASTNDSIKNGILEFQQWVDDQIRMGIGAFLTELQPRCRRISARLVDAKAQGLASRVDEVATKVLSYPSAIQPEIVYQELGQLILLTKAWLVDPNDIDAHRAISTAESKEQILESSDTLKVTALWENIGEAVFTRKDGLISHTTWLLNLQNNSTQFTLLQDYYPASTGKRSVGLAIGSQLEGEVAYYPSRVALRGFLKQQKIPDSIKNITWPNSGISLNQQFQQQLQLLPWLERCPYILPDGNIMRSKDHGYWWQAKNTNASLPIPLSNQHIPKILLGSDLSRAFILWDGRQAEVLSAQTQLWGTVSC